MMGKTAGKKLVRNLCLIYIAALLAGCLSMSLVYMLPVEKMARHVAGSKEVFIQEGVYPRLMAEHLDSTLDNWTDAVMLLIAGYDGGEESAFAKAASNLYWLGVEADNPAESLAAFYSGEAQEYSAISYARYWHGYNIYLKPLLLFFRYQEIRYILGAVQLVLLLAVTGMFASRKMIKEAAAFGITYLFLNPAVLLLSMQNSQVFILVLLQFIIILRFDRIYERNTDVWVYHFFIVGCLTSFFDFLTYPLAAFGITGAFLIYEYTETAREGIAAFLKTAAAWGCGYVFMWAGKWIIGSMVLKRNVIREAASVIQTRSGYQTADLHFTYLDVLVRNTGVRRYFLGMLVLFVMACFMTGIRNRVKMEPKNALYIVFILLPYAWYFLAANHSYIHCWFTYREIAVSVFSLVLLGMSFCGRRSGITLDLFQQQ